MAVNKIRRNGSFTPLSAQYYKDDAIAEAGERAELLYVRGLAFGAEILQDGYISHTQLERFPGVGMKDAQKRAIALCEVDLWIPDDRGGYTIRSWSKWNQLMSEIKDKQAADAARKAGTK